MIANMGFKSSQTANCGVCGEATFYNISHGFIFVVSVVGCAYLFSRENALKLKETFIRIIKIRWRINAWVHQGYKLGTINLRA